MKNASVCEMCGNPLPAMSKGYLCSVACRKAKSRLGTEAGKNMIDARNSIRRVIKALDLDVISSSDSYDEYMDLRDMLEKLARAHNARYDREMSQRDREAEREKH